MNNPVKYIAENRIVEKLADDYMVESFYKDDLIQEIYMILLTYNPQTLQTIIDKKQIRFFVARILHNQYFSKTSDFFRKYKRPVINKETLKTILDNEEGQED